MAQFGEDTPLTERVLLPATSAESRGLEDARFVRFTEDDGTPVIANSRGSMGELIDDEVTGVLIGGAAEAVSTVERIGELNRQKIRDVAVARFSADRMVQEYEAVYGKVIAASESLGH